VALVFNVDLSEDYVCFSQNYLFVMANPDSSLQYSAELFNISFQSANAQFTILLFRPDTELQRNHLLPSLNYDP
jgi:hypothetical protein